MENINFTPFAQEILDNALIIAHNLRSEFFMPEHFLQALTECRPIIRHKYETPIDFKQLNVLLFAINDDVPKIIDPTDDPEPSYVMKRVLKRAKQSVKGSFDTPVPSVAILIAILNERESVGSQLVGQHIDNLQELAEVMLALDSKSIMSQDSGNIDDGYFGDIDSDENISGWKKYIVDLKEKYLYGEQGDIVGRDNEISRIVQVLCRHDKNNALVVGNPGVGKSAVIRGMISRLYLYPEKISGLPVYEIPVQALLAGAQYQGEIEQRVSSIMSGIKSDGGAIIVLDDMHTLAGSKGDANGSRDLTQLFIQYLDDENLRFVGITNHEDITRYMDGCTRFLRRFQQIDIDEPSPDETLMILDRIKHRYEKYHGVKYLEGTMQHIVRLCERFLSDRYFPDKAIDVLDEAGAYRLMHPLVKQKRQSVDAALITGIVAQMSKTESRIVDNDNMTTLKNLYANLKSQIFGQDKALQSVVESVLAARAGLSDEHKPQASLLFVGPTGVGKTEVAKVLSEQLGLTLHKFDMSEYSESYSVSKLIGSSPGYVGYEEGGRLTEAVRKTPHCVLLLDEIEKAHEKIYDTLLQVMDYASLTDSRGRKVDFRHVILIMTSNSGAQYAKQAGLGFGSTVTTGQAMLGEVKKTFKPEFINRLSSIVVFNDMNRGMATLILDKKLNELNKRLIERNVTITFAHEAKEWLLNKGFSDKYGAREIERVINRNLKPILVNEILFGKLSKNKSAEIVVENDTLKLKLSK